MMFTLQVGFFTPLMFVLYLTFVPPERAKALADTLKQWSIKLAALVQRPSIPAEIVGEDSGKGRDVEAERSTALASQKSKVRLEYTASIPLCDDEDSGESDNQVALVKNADGHVNSVNSNPPKLASAALKESSGITIRD
jgi:hypothetical protein